MRPGSYDKWVRSYDTITPADRLALQREEAELRERPLLSILLPVYNPQLDWLAAAIDSVRRQTYSRWELCIADDASTQPGVRPFLAEQAKTDPRIKLVFRADNGHISACSNSALALATGSWCGLLDQDDVLREHALSLVAREINAHPDAGLIYSDEDFLDPNGARANPFFKPEWNPQLFLGQNYINHFGIYRTDLLRTIGGFREGFEGSQDYDLALRCIARLQHRQIRHIPRILYHWRMVPGSLADARDAKPYAKDAARRALAEHVQATGIAAEVEPCPENIESHRVRYAVPSPRPEMTMLPVDCGAAELNRRAFAAHADVLVFHAPKLEFVEAEWADELLSQAMQSKVAAVGARLWSPNETMRGTGFLLGAGGVAADAHEGLPRGHAGYFNRAFLQRNCSAVSLACFATRADVFRELGGFDAANLARDFLDLDYCLRAAERGLQTVWTPYANAIDRRAETPAEAAGADEAYMRRRWAVQLPNDPFYSPNLALDDSPFELAFPPRWWRGSAVS